MSSPSQQRRAIRSAINPVLTRSEAAANEHVSVHIGGIAAIPTTIFTRAEAGEAGVPPPALKGQQLVLTRPPLGVPADS